MHIPKVTNMTSPRTDSPVANQFIIEYGQNAEVFQSYNTPIAMRCGTDDAENDYIISDNYNYSMTTSKYFNRWLDRWMNYEQREEVRKWLKKYPHHGDVLKLRDRNDQYDIKVKFVEELM